MSARPDNSTCTFGAGILIKYLQALLQEVEGVRSAKDIEHIHRMRVASRRLRSAMPLFASCYPEKKVRIWLKEIRKITQALGAARDADVQIDRLTGIYRSLPDPAYRPGVRRLLIRLKQQRAGMQTKVLKTLDKLMESGATSEMRLYFREQQPVEDLPVAYSQELYRLAYQAIQGSLDDLFSYEPYIYNEACVAELHAMRVDAKRLRYTLETFSAIYPPQLEKIVKVVRKIQDTLGEIHDSDVWVSYLPTFLEEERKRILDFYGTAGPAWRITPGIQYLQETRRAERQDLYQGFLKNWEQWEKEGLWKTLEEMLRLPVSFNEEIYPPAPPIEGESEPGVLEEK